MVGGALGLGGGHYTGSDAQRPPPPAVEPSATEASPSPEIAFPVMIGGAPGLGGGHYTVSDAELLGAAAKQPAAGPGALERRRTNVLDLSARPRWAATAGTSARSGVH